MIFAGTRIKRSFFFIKNLIEGLPKNSIRSIKAKPDSLIYKQNLTYLDLENTIKSYLISSLDCCCCCMYDGKTEVVVAAIVSGEVTPTVIVCGFCF